MAVVVTKCSNCGCEHKIETDRVKDWSVKKCFVCGETVKFKVKAEEEETPIVAETPEVVKEKNSRRKSA